MESEDILVMLSDGAFDGFSQNGLEMAARYLKWMWYVHRRSQMDYMSKLQQTKNLKKEMI